MIDYSLSEKLRFNIVKSKLVFVEIHRLNYLNVFVSDNRLDSWVRLVGNGFLDGDGRFWCKSFHKEVYIGGVFKRQGLFVIFGLLGWLLICVKIMIGILCFDIFIFFHIHLNISSNNRIDLKMNVFFLLFIVVILLILLFKLIIILKLENLSTITCCHIWCFFIILILEIVRYS